ncbi:hypothetical protein GCM10010995_23540 [Cysteiniphilum litorale]|uniref:Uncharacterized protein n=1 Tax=Cysteiniphilum litorale TaxID=2056700 RepID=A0A8J2Z6J2_9GAMM|nr:hypothetical protein GCM10010995_23540 [Cysteiniphilum litorale]
MRCCLCRICIKSISEIKSKILKPIGENDRVKSAPAMSAKSVFIMKDICYNSEFILD